MAHPVAFKDLMKWLEMDLCDINRERFSYSSSSPVSTNPSFRLEAALSGLSDKDYTGYCRTVENVFTLMSANSQACHACSRGY